MFEDSYITFEEKTVVSFTGSLNKLYPFCILH